MVRILGRTTPKCTDTSQILLDSYLPSEHDSKQFAVLIPPTLSVSHTQIDPR